VIQFDRLDRLDDPGKESIIGLKGGSAIIRPTNRHFDLLAAAYDRLLGPPPAGPLAAALALPIRGWLLDAGGGTGRVSSALRPSTGGAVVADLSREMLRQSVRKTGLVAVRACTEQLPFPDSAFERILVVDALHHFSDRDRALAELNRVLLPGGRILIEEPDLNRLAVKLVAAAEKMLWMESHFTPPAAIGAELVRLGLTVSIRRRGTFRVWITADKPPLPDPA
jgi:demethylmenaquinone methyltransferase/2-methoxy-6-polyprenyl-1,4-benzoquinol methylase